jgi:hypothetical protein
MSIVCYQNLCEVFRTVNMLIDTSRPHAEHLGAQSYLFSQSTLFFLNQCDQLLRNECVADGNRTNKILTQSIDREVAHSLTVLEL